MPKGSPFTTLCGRLASLSKLHRADLHTHTLASDGEYTPSQVAALASMAGLCAVAITDHDTLAGVEEARATAAGRIEIVPGVEISSEYGGREVHLLGYFLRPDDCAVNERLAWVRAGREDRFHEFVARLAHGGACLPQDRVALVAARSASLGRRHLAGLLVDCGFVKTRTEAFHRHLGPLGKHVLPKRLIPVHEAIELVNGADGVASLAHPPADLMDDDFHRLAGFGLSALEAEYPWSDRAASARLRDAARRHGLAVSGGSDCHGPEPARRRIGSYGIAPDELERLRELSNRCREGGPGPSERPEAVAPPVT